MLEVDISDKTGLSDVIFKAIMYTKENILSKLLETLYEEKNRTNTLFK